jgi:hypothetical protein
MACTANLKWGPIELTYVDILSNEAIVPLACTPAFWKVASLICVADSISSVLGGDRKIKVSKTLADLNVRNGQRACLKIGRCLLFSCASFLRAQRNISYTSIDVVKYTGKAVILCTSSHKGRKKTSVWVEICERVALPLWQTQCILHTALALGLKWQLWVFNACIT